MRDFSRKAIFESFLPENNAPEKTECTFRSFPPENRDPEIYFLSVRSIGIYFPNFSREFSKNFRINCYLEKQVFGKVK